MAESSGNMRGAEKMKKVQDKTANKRNTVFDEEEEEEEEQVRQGRTVFTGKTSEYLVASSLLTTTS